MQGQFELVEVEPLCGLLRLQVVVGVPGGEPERAELGLRGEQQSRGRLLVVEARLTAW